MRPSSRNTLSTASPLQAKSPVVNSGSLMAGGKCALKVR